MAAPDGDSAPEPEHSEAVELRADGRTLSGPVVRYGDLGRGGTERFAPGAFSPDRASDPLRLNVGHDRSESVVVPLPVEYRDDALAVNVTLPEGRTADRIDRGELRGLSVGFVALAETRDSSGIRVIEKAHSITWPS
ncbi:MAG: HK97 family phage prohead protease [Acidimicrobiaceae bacterium]|nr:HK97 family phage prohead protease [Acidimicrobiaceae bacterium]